MEKEISLEKIKKIKEDAEAYIKQIIKRTEEETGCCCEGISLFLKDEEPNTFSVDVKLVIELDKSGL